MQLEQRREVLDMLIAENDEIQAEKHIQELAIESLRINNLGITYQVSPWPISRVAHSAAVFIGSSVSRMRILVSAICHRTTYSYSRYRCISSKRCCS